MNHNWMIIFIFETIFYLKILLKTTDEYMIEQIYPFTFQE